MKPFTKLIAQATCALSASILVAACGGGDASPPPSASGINAPTTAPPPDTGAPTVTIFDDVSAATATGPVTFTFVFNKDVGASFTAADIVVTGGTPGTFTMVSGTQATLVVTPTANTSGTIDVSVAAGTFSDIVGNINATGATALQAHNTTVAVVETRLLGFDEATPPVLAGFGGAEDATLVADPTNAANKVVKVVKSATAELWAGVTVSTCPNSAIPTLPFTSALKTLTARVWSPTAGTVVRLKVEDAADATKSVETEATTTTANGWQTLSFDFGNQAAGTAAISLSNTYNKLSVFFGFGTTGAQAGAALTYYLDDVSFDGSNFTAACAGAGGGGGGGGGGATTTIITMDEATPPVLTGFGGAEDATVVADPDNAANKVAKVVKSATAELWAGVTVSNLANQAVAPIAFSATEQIITVKVWSPTAGTPVRLKVENAADPTQSVETEATTTVANGWQTLSFNFANQAAGTAALNLAYTYNKVSIFFNFGTTGQDAGGARTYYFEDVVFPSASAGGGGGGGGGAGTTATLTMDEATPPLLTGFGGAEDATVVADPTNAANKVAKVVKSATAELWAGVTVSNLANQAVAPMAFTASNQIITVRVWSPTAGTPVRLKVEEAADPTRSVETEATTTVAGDWQTLSFNFANPAAGTAALNLAYTYNKVSIFFNFGTTGQDAGGARTYYFEDLSYATAAAGGGGGGGGTTLGLPITFDDAGTTYTLTGFGGAEDATLVADPTGGTNQVMRVVKSGTAELWAGTTVSTDANQSIATLPFTATAMTMTARVYVPTAGIPVRLKIEDAADPTRSVETEATATVAGGWQTLTFNFASQAAGTAAINLAFAYNKASVFFNFGTPGSAGGGGTFYFDDLAFVP